MHVTLLFRNLHRILPRIVFSYVLLFIAADTYAQTVTTNTQSTHNGFFYSFWNDGSKGTASMTLGAAGNYSTTWNNIGNFTAGKGWAVGKADRVVCFSGNFNGGSNGFLALYGWTKNNLIEYYVCENHGQWTPPGNTSDIVRKGTYTSDGGTYTIYTATRTNQPSIVGTATFQQFWSVRTEKRSSGTITFANHVAAWKAAGLNMGTTWDYQIMESEGYNSSGSSNITVSECVSCATPAPVTTASFDYEVGATATQLTATGTALKWYTAATGGTALPSAPTPSTTVSGTTKYYVGQTLNGCEGVRAEVTIRVSQRYKIYKVPSPITIDGTIEASWTNASVLPAAATKLLSGAVTNSADLSGNFKALWDDTYLYILADVTDDTKINESANVYDDDGVEVYVDINNDKATTYGANDAQYTFGWNDGTTVGVLPAGRSVTNITYKAVATTGGYVVEARIPWTTISGSPAIGQLLGIDFMINDDDNNGTRDGKLSWNADTDDAWQNPSLFGVAVLQGPLPCTTPAAPIVTASVAYCLNAPATALTATGTSLLWYTTSVNGTGSPTAIIPETTTAGTVNYYVTQNIGGCESARAQIAVTVNALPAAIVTAGSGTTFCSGGSVMLTASTGSSYVWKNGTAEVGNSSSYSATTAGSYTVEVTNAANCKATSTATVVTVNVAPAAPQVTPTAAYCQGAAAAQLTANGTALKWYADNTATASLPSAPVPSTTSAGTTNYYVSQTTNGCESARAQIAVTVNALPAATITAGSGTTFCSGGSVMLTASTGSSYVWKNGTAEVGNSSSYSATTAGSYTVEVTNAANCKATSTATVVTVNAAPAAPQVSTPAAYCQGGTAAQLTANGTALKWYADNTATTSLPSAPVPSTTSAGTANYYVSQTTNGCESARAQIAVTVNALPAATVTAGSGTTFCSGGSVMLTASTGSSYVWKNGTAEVGNSSSYSATTAGSYTVEVTNAANCKATSTATVVTVNVAPAAPQVTPTAAYCQGAAAAQLTANGTALKWYADNTATASLPSAPVPSTTSAGTANYYVSQTTNGCESARAQIAVTVNAAPAAPQVSTPAAYCQGGTAAQLTANGTALKWYADNTVTTSLPSAPVPSTTSAGTTNYYVTQTTNGCESPRAEIAVTVYTLPAAIITASGPTAIISGGSVTLNANTGSGFTYKWFRGTVQVGANNSYVAEEAGDYTLDVSNAAGCKTTSQIVQVTIVANQPSVIYITSPVSNAVIEGAITITVTVSDPDGSIVLVEYLDGGKVIGSGTSQPFTFDWVNPGTGTHVITVRVTDNNGGVTTSDPVTITSEAITTSVMSGNNVYANVYPIPARDEVVVETELDLSDASVKITNALGEEVAASISMQGSNLKLHLNGLAEGTYILVIRKGSNIVTKKILIVH
jgi:hypothetical protein